jgi:hypothetical protein
MIIQRLATFAACAALALALSGTAQADPADGSSRPGADEERPVDRGGGGQAAPDGPGPSFNDPNPDRGADGGQGDTFPGQGIAANWPPRPHGFDNKRFPHSCEIDCN